MCLPFLHTFLRQYLLLAQVEVDTSDLLSAQGFVTVWTRKLRYCKREPPVLDDWR